MLSNTIRKIIKFKHSQTEAKLKQQLTPTPSPKQDSQLL